MCDPCIEQAKAEIPKLSRNSVNWRFPVLFYGDLRHLSEAIGTKNLAWMMDIAPMTIRVALKVEKGRKRLPKWLAQRVYRPLWGKWALDWLHILPTRVHLQFISARLRPFHSGHPQGIRTIRDAVFLLPRRSQSGSTSIPKT